MENPVETELLYFSLSLTMSHRKLMFFFAIGRVWVELSLKALIVMDREINNWY
jgi:hypothetical protein